MLLLVILVSYCIYWCDQKYTSYKSIVKLEITLIAINKDADTILPFLNRQWTILCITHVSIAMMYGVVILRGQGSKMSFFFLFHVSKVNTFLVK